VDERPELPDPSAVVPDPTTAPSPGSDRRSGAPQQRLEAPSPAIEAAFSEFYRGFIKRLVGFLMWQGARLQDAADIAQQTMALAYQSWETIQRPEAWAHTVASRALARRIASIDEDPVEQLPERSALLSAPVAAGAWEDQQEILRLLRELPPRQRQVMAWTFDGYSPAEIAEQLRITPEAVRASLQKARRTLAMNLGSTEGDLR
jgi:RNA polymerase sigma factor (sigma-70 family)